MVLGYGWKPIAIILLKKHSSKMTPQDIMLYSYLWTSLNPHERNFLQQTVVNINKETQNWTMCRDWGILEHSPTNGMSLSNLFLQSSRIYAEENTERLLKRCKMRMDFLPAVIRLSQEWLTIFNFRQQETQLVSRSWSMWDL